MENPYESPQDLSAIAARPSRGWAEWVPFVAICLMIEGGLELLMAAFLIFVGACVPLAALAGDNAAAQFGNAMWLIFGFYVGLGVLVLAAAVVKLVAGWRNYQFRSRTLGFVALGSCLPMVLSGFCLPTSLFVAIFGLIVYLDTESARGFEMAQQGYTGQQIKAQVRV